MFDAANLVQLLATVHADEQVVLGYDRKLLRRVWLHVQPLSTAEVSVPRHQSACERDLRWLGGRRSDHECWDCYEAPSGAPLAKLHGAIGGVRACRIEARSSSRFGWCWSRRTVGTTRSGFPA